MRASEKTPRETPRRIAHERMMVVAWKAEDVQWQVTGMEAWFFGIDGGRLLDILHSMPHDMNDLLRASAGQEEFLSRDDDEFATRGRDLSERRLKALRQKLFESLQRRLVKKPILPNKPVQRIMLQRRLLNAAWSAVSSVITSAVQNPQVLTPRMTQEQKMRYSAARVLLDYATKYFKATTMSTPADLRLLTRAADGLRFALSSPGAVAAAYAHASASDPIDSSRRLLSGSGDHLNGKTIFQLAARNLATTLLEATKISLLGLEHSASFKSTRRPSGGFTVVPTSLNEKKPSVVRLSIPADTIDDDDDHQVGEEKSPNSPLDQFTSAQDNNNAQKINEAIRLMRSTLCALCALCPEKKEVIKKMNSNQDILNNTAAAGAVQRQQQLELVCNEILIPVAFMLEHVVGKAVPDPAFRTRVERAIRGPFSSLLYLLSWHDDNLVSLFATQRNVIVRAALYWLALRSNTPTGESEQLIRRNLITVIWSFAKKKDRALELGTPDMIHPLLNCLAHTENQRDIRFIAAGALEKILTHRSSLTMMPKDDLGSEITMSKRSLPSVFSDNEPPPPPLLAAVLKKLLPTLGIIFLGGAFDEDEEDNEIAPSSGYLQLILAACANLVYLAIACEKEQPEYTTWLRDELQRHLLLKSKESEHRSIMVTGDIMIAIQAVPELQEPRVFYEALRLLWVLLRLRIHPNDRNDTATRSLFYATGELDVECASAGVIFDNVLPDDLKLHFIQDLLRYIQSEEHDISKRDTEPLRAFTTWILAHYTYRHDDAKHITYQNAFNIIACLIIDNSPSALFTIIQKAIENDANILIQQNYNNVTAKLLTLRLLARCLRNLAQSEITATLVVEHTKLGTAGALHALNRLAWLGWCIEATRANSMFEPVPAVTMYLTSGGHYYRQLASHEIIVDEKDSNRKQHVCVPVVVRLDHTDPHLKRRIRHGATDEIIRFFDKDETSTYQVRAGCVPNSIQILQEVAQTLEHLAAHNQIRGFFATHGTLGLVVRLALHNRFRAGIAFRILLDTPRAALVNHVIMSYTNQQSGGGFNFDHHGSSTLFFTTPSHRTKKMHSPRPRWLIADINELILRALEFAPPIAVNNTSEANNAQAAALLAIQLATSMLVHDDTKHRPSGQSRAQENFRGGQVLVYYAQTGELMTGVCLKIYGPSTQSTVDVIMDSGNVHYGVTLKYITMVELSQQSNTPRSASSVSHHSQTKDDDLTAYFVQPSNFGSRNVETSLFSYFVHEGDRFFSALDRCSSNINLAPDASSLCETLSNVLRRYLHSGDVELTNDILGHLGVFCERQLSRLVSDCACDVCPDCPSALQNCIGKAAYTGGRGQLFTTFYLFEASVLLYRHKQYASCSHRGFVFGIPTLMLNAVSALHAQIYNSGLGELPAHVQLKMIQLSEQIRKPHAENTSNNEDTDEGCEREGLIGGDRKRSLTASLTEEGRNNNTDTDEDVVRNGNNLVNSTFRAVLAVLELARAADAHRIMRKSESQPILLKEMMTSQRKIHSLENNCLQVLTHRENSAQANNKTQKRPSDVRVLDRSSVNEHDQNCRDKHKYTRKILFGTEGVIELDDVYESKSGQRKRTKNKWSMNADETPFYSKLRALCCQVVRLGVGPRTVRLDQEVHSQHSAIRSSLRLLSSLGPDMLMARRLQESPPTASKKFVTALIRCIKWHPHWTQAEMVRREEHRRHSGQDAVSLHHTTAISTIASTLPSAQVGDLLAIEACKLVQQLSTHLSQRHLMVFPDTARKQTTVRKRREYLLHATTSDEASDDDFISAYNNENDEAMRQRSKNGCLPVLTTLAGAFRGDVSNSVRAAAVGALKEIASNSTICSEAICAHDGVKQLVIAAHVGDHALRRNVALIFSLIAMTPSIREQLLKEHYALLLLLQLQAPRDNPYFDDDTQIVAYAAKALKYLSSNTALVYLEALKIGVARIEVWNTMCTYAHNCAKNNHVTTTVGVSLLGPGYQELLQLALNGLGDAASHAEMADVLIANRGIETLLDCLQIRNADIITSTVRTLASLMNQAVAFERRRHSSTLIYQVVDRLLILLWPYAHRAARTLQSVCRQRMSIRKTGIVSEPLSLTLVPVSSSLIGIVATAIERVARDHGLGDYLVHKRAIDALIARLTPDGYKEDEEECMHLYATSKRRPKNQSKDSGSKDETRGSRAKIVQVNSRNEYSSGSLKEDPPIINVLSAIAQLAHNTPHSLPTGRPERTLSIVYAFHHNKRCRHLAMLALWRIRPVATFGLSTDPIVQAKIPQELYQEGQNASLAPPPPIYWDDDDVITWLGCVGFGSLGKSMRKYLSRIQTNVVAHESLMSAKWKKSRNYSHSGWTRGSVDKAHDPYGQATAGEKLLALTSADFQVGGRLCLTKEQVAALELGAFASELRELHLQMREANQLHVYDVRVPMILLRSSIDDEGVKWPQQIPTSPRRIETEVILHARLVRRYRALYAEAQDILAASEERNAALSLSDLAFDTITEARRAYESYTCGDIQDAKAAAALARTHAAKVVDAVTLNRVKLSATRESEGLSNTLDDIGDMLLGGAIESDTLRWGDTLWYELSSAPTIANFNQSRLIDADDTSHENSSGVLNSNLPANAIVKENNDEQSELSSAWVDVEDVCLWPTEGYGVEAARVRRERRYKKTPNGILQKSAKEPIRDKRGIAHLFEVRFIDARVLLPGGRTALMMCAKEGDLPMVKLLLDKVESHLNERLAPTMLDVLRQHTRRRRQKSVQLNDDRDLVAATRNIHSSVFEVLDPGARPNAVDEHGNTALHHALRSLLRGVEKVREGLTMNPDHLFSRIEIVQILLERVALPHSAAVFSHGKLREESDKSDRMFVESYHGIPNDALSLLIRCYSRTQRRPHISEQNISDEIKKTGYPLNEALEVLAEKIDGLLALMIQCGFPLTSSTVREAENAHLLSRLRYLYVEHCNLSTLEGLLRTVPDVFLKRNIRIDKMNSDLDIGPVLPRSYTNPWEAPVFATKRLQTTTQKVWMSRMVYHVNRQLLMYVMFIFIILYVAADIVGMDIFLVSRDALQQALRTRLVEEEWYPSNGFLEIATPEDWWKWAEGPLLDAIYEPALPRWKKDGSLDAYSHGQGTFPLLGGLGISLGQPRLRMVATQPNEQNVGACAYKPAKKKFGRADDACFSYFGERVQMDRTLRLNDVDANMINQTTYDFMEFMNPAHGWLGIDAPSIYGYQAYYPGSGGYIATLPKDEDKGRALIASLKNTSWVSQNTRAIMLEFMCYSPSDHHSHNLITNVRLLAEFSATGAVLCSGHIRAMRLFLYKTSRDYFRLILEIGWLIGCFFLFRSEVQQMAASFEREVIVHNPTFKIFIQKIYRFRRGISNYAVAHFNIFDLAQFHTFVLLFLSHIFSITFASNVNWDQLIHTVDDIDRQIRSQLSTVSIAMYLGEIRLTLLGLYVLLSFLKLLDRMRVRESLHVLIVEEMFKKIFTFLIVMTICVLAFSFTSFFSHISDARQNLRQGSLFLDSFVSQMRAFQGEIDFNAFESPDPYLGVLFAILTFLVLPVLLMNLLIAIMLEAYESVRGAAAARYCYLQLVAHSEYLKQSVRGDSRTPTNATHWIALTLGAVFFPILVIERIITITRRGLHYVWTDVFYPEGRQLLLASSMDSEDSAECDEPPKILDIVKTFRKIKLIRRFNKVVRVHPASKSAAARKAKSPIVKPISADILLEDD